MMKLVLINFYNFQRRGVDIVDKMINDNCCQPEANSWPLVVFTFVIDLAAINARTILGYNVPSAKKQRRVEFLKDLAIQLCEPHIRCRRKVPSLQQNVLNAIDSVLNSIEHPRQDVRDADDNAALDISDSEDINDENANNTDGDGHDDRVDDENDGNNNDDGDGSETEEEVDDSVGGNKCHLCVKELRDMRLPDKEFRKKKGNLQKRLKTICHCCNY